MCEEFVGLIKHWNLSPFAAMGWVLAGVLVWRSIVIEGRRERMLRTWLEQSLTEKAHQIAVNQSMNDHLTQLSRELAVLAAKVE